METFRKLITCGEWPEGWSVEIDHHGVAAMRVGDDERGGNQVVYKLWQNGDVTGAETGVPTPTIVKQAVAAAFEWVF